MIEDPKTGVAVLVVALFVLWACIMAVTMIGDRRRSAKGAERCSPGSGPGTL
jgi:hypothetical protein